MFEINFVRLVACMLFFFNIYRFNNVWYNNSNCPLSRSGFHFERRVRKISYNVNFYSTSLVLRIAKRQFEEKKIILMLERYI